MPITLSKYSTIDDHINAMAAKITSQSAVEGEQLSRLGTKKHSSSALMAFY